MLEMEHFIVKSFQVPICQFLFHPCGTILSYWGARVDETFLTRIGVPLLTMFFLFYDFRRTLLDGLLGPSDFRVSHLCP